MTEQTLSAEIIEGLDGYVPVKNLREAVKKLKGKHVHWRIVMGNMAKDGIDSFEEEIDEIFGEKLI